MLNKQQPSTQEQQPPSSQEQQLSPQEQQRKQDIADNLQDILSNIKNAKRTESRDVTLVAISKYKPASDILHAYGTGQVHFGENVCRKRQKIE